MGGGSGVCTRTDARRFAGSGPRKYHPPKPKDRPDTALVICWRRRDEVQEHVARAFGPERTAMISTLNRFGLRGHEAIAFEDSHAGSLAAKRANLWAVAVPNESTAHHDFSHADLRVASLADATLDDLTRRFGAAE